MKIVLQHLRQRPYFILGIIVLFAAFLRFYDVSHVPVSLYWDETASAYNAYSIALTGKDEFGIPFPLLFKSFEDYKAPGNIYLMSIAVRLFGLNEFSARFTSCLAGTLTVLFVFFLTKELLSISKFQKVEFFRKKIEIDENMFALLTTFFLAISPWHIQFSRTGFEANVALAFVISGVWLFFRSLHLKKQIYFYYALVLFAIAFYMYRSIWVFLPLFLLSLFFIFRKALFSAEQRKTTLIGIILFLLVLSPFIPVIFSENGLVRARQVNVFTNSNQQLIDAAQKRVAEGMWGKIFFNQRLVYPEIIAGNYLSNFSPQFLFFSGDPEGRHGPRGMGLLYVWEIPFIFIGLYLLIRKSSGTFRNVIVSWILIAPIPAAFSFPNPHALRDLNILPMPQVLTALGVYVCFFLIQKRMRFLYAGIMSIMIIVLFVYYLYLYYGVTARVTSADWADGYKELSAYMIPRENQYDKLVVTGHYWKPYIYFLFYKQYDPATYQKEHGNEFHFGKYVFSGTSWGGQKELDNIDLQKFAGAKHIIVAMSPSEWETQKNKMHYLTTIKNHDNQVVFIVGDEN